MFQGNNFLRQTSPHQSTSRCFQRIIGGKRQRVLQFAGGRHLGEERPGFFETAAVEPRRADFFSNPNELLGDESS